MIMISENVSGTANTIAVCVLHPYLEEILNFSKGLVKKIKM